MERRGVLRHGQRRARLAGSVETRRGRGRPLAVAGRADPYRLRLGAQRSGHASANTHQRRSRPVKVLARLFAAVLALGVAALLMLMLLAMSDSGLHWAYRIVAALVPGQLTIDTLEGRLLGPLQLRGVHYARAGTKVDIGRIDLDWSPDQLLHATLHIRNLVVDDVDVRYTSAPAAESKQAVTLPTLSLPIYLRVDRAELNRLRVTERSAGPTFELTRARIAADWRGDSGAIHEFSVNAPRYDLSASGTLRSEDDYPLDLALHWRYDSGDYGVWSGAGRIRGDLKQLRIDQRVDAPLAATVKGTLSDLTTAPAWALELAAGEFNQREIHAAWPDLKISGLVRSSGHVTALTARAAVRAGVTTAHGEQPDIRGELRGHAFDGRSRLNIAGERIELSQFDLHANGNRVSAAGTLAQQWDLGWTVVASDLGALMPEVGGALGASGRVAGPRATP